MHKPFSKYCFPKGMSDAEIVSHYTFYANYANADDKWYRVCAALLEELAEAKGITLKPVKNKMIKKEKLEKTLDKVTKSD